MFHSYKGGSGKTILSINVANTLVTKFNKRVLLIEADFGMPSFNNIFTSFNQDIYFNDYLSQESDDLGKFIYPNTSSKFGIIFSSDQFRSKDKVHSTEQTWFLKKTEQLRRDIKKLDYDYVIFDLSPGFHFFTINALMLSDEVVVVLRPDYHSFASTITLLSKIYAKAIMAGQIRTHLIFNQIPDFDKMNSLVDSWIIELQNEYNFLNQIYKFKFHFETSYNAAIQQIVLPDNDPLIKEIDNFIKEIKL